MLSSIEIKKEIFRRYNNQPKGWHVLVNKDLKGHYDTIFVHGKDIWFLKEEFVKPYEPVGFGIADTIDYCDALDSIKSYQYGFRPLTKKLLNELEQQSTYDKQGRSNLIKKIINTKPVSLDKINSKIAVHGPMFFPNHPINLMSNQNDLDLKLRIELEKLLYRKFPYLLTTYG